MQKRLFLSLAAIIVLVTTVIFLTHVGQAADPQKQAPIQSGPGRYQLVINPNIRADAYLLDTQTGKIWSKMKYTDLRGEPTVWQFEDRVDNTEELLRWSKNFAR